MTLGFFVCDELVRDTCVLDEKKCNVLPIVRASTRRIKRLLESGMRDCGANSMFAALSWRMVDSQEMERCAKRPARAIRAILE